MKILEENCVVDGVKKLDAKILSFLAEVASGDRRRGDEALTEVYDAWGDLYKTLITINES